MFHDRRLCKNRFPPPAFFRGVIFPYNTGALFCINRKYRRAVGGGGRVRYYRCTGGSLGWRVGFGVVLAGGQWAG